MEMDYTVPVIAGDGVGPEIIAEGKKVIEAAARREEFQVTWIDFPHGTEHYLKTGETLSHQALEELGKYRAIYMGSLGDPRVPAGVVEMGIILKTRFYFDQYVNLRPVKLLEGVDTPLKDKGPKDIDFVVIRENTEDFYIGLGHRVKRGKNHVLLDLQRQEYRARFDIDVETSSEEIGFHLGIISKEGARRIIQYGFELARKKGKNKVTCLDKANVLASMYNFWREVAEEVAQGYPEIQLEIMLADAATMWFVKNPERFQVVVAPNLFGDIVTDLGAMIAGGLGMAPGGNINPEGTSMFEPIHGSAPKYAGQNRANPIATIWSGALMLDFLGETKAADRIVWAIEQTVMEKKVLTPDLGGTAGTRDVGDEIARKVAG